MSGSERTQVGVSMDPTGWPVFRLHQMDDFSEAALAATAQRIEAALNDFTWEDVDALRGAADDVEGDDPDPFVYQEVGRLHSIADRIAALLPPRETP